MPSGFPVSLARPFLIGLSLALASLAWPACAAETPGDLQKRLESEAAPKIGDRTLDPAPLTGFYRQRGHRLAWTEGKGERVVGDILAVAAGEGLSADNYAIPATNSAIDRDLLISDALARFGHDLATGRIAPTRSVGGMGPDTRPSFDATRFLIDLSSGKDVAALLEVLPPPYAGYQRLKLALEHYRKLVAAGGWPVIPDGTSIKAEAEDERLLLVRRRLIMTGELAAAHDKGKRLDKPLADALKTFQNRHGIEPDGFVGKQTLTALNVPAEERMRQVQANLERWRWMPHRLDSSHIAVNLPAAHLELVREGRIDLAMRVVVGDVKSPTPTMATTLSSVVLNPTWTVPPGIATKEILPKLRKEPNYLVANNMVILDAFDGDSAKQQGIGIDWSRQSRFPGRLRQRPGPDNALGQIKFNLSNSDDIYLHDTPKRQYFGRIFRALSHGCVRLERPLDLAKSLIGGEMADKVPELISAADTKTIKLDKALTVYLMYFTAWAEEDGTVHFRDDLYGHDARLKAALKRPARVGPAN
ncbi:hypothetical protein A6A05_05440 [Magnetospirillum moscoviense]|uniref:L,D-TPase catalytic domain-containing protein n=1 Tax=Magnetospirillum moscoviense TaxID=1437059 RepID=A0A178MZM9_9PROT|nr:hypothetical protein A6A05_05440 [Magnetospirillum moscoviense]